MDLHAPLVDLPCTLLLGAAALGIGALLDDLLPKLPGRE